MKKAVIFDMDGTLVDNNAAHFRAFSVFCDRFGSKDWENKLKACMGMGNDDIMRALLPAEVIEKVGIPALAEEKEAIYRETYASEIKPIDGLHQLLQSLTESGIACAIGSSGPTPNIDFVMDSCDIRKYFKTYICGDQVTKCKPDPEIYLKAAEALAVAPEDCVVFEDAQAGIEAAYRAGAGRIVAMTTSCPREVLENDERIGLVIDSFEDITDIEALLK